MVKLPVVFLCIGYVLLTLADDGDFDLKDALDPNDKPSEPTKKPPGGNKPRPNLYPDLRPYSDNHGNGGGFNDLDLNDGKPLAPRPAGEKEQTSGQGGNMVDSATTAQITSPVVAVAVLLTVGAIAGYTSYKQKRYCFKPRGDAVA
ncbi:glycoprotein Xg isoform X2 [Pantherophis guttatus]|uniref:Glycoprotein Xg isoform X2 n=1 Tax=Pantherophis guttatus TaxID=94885 RepID=A0A6P9D582_PANGU|nr:glycoprotein Xg isoform X2 [Pantherophis guttatus]